MPTYYARKAGTINAADVWATTPAGTAGDFFSTFTNADVLMANSFSISINVNATVAEVRNDTTGGATAGGQFTLSNGVTLAANSISGPVACVVFAGLSPNTATIVGSCTGGSASGANGANNNSTGTLFVTGNCTGGSASSSYGAFNNSTGSLTITGNCTGGSASNAHGVFNNSTGSLTITGNCIGGSTTAVGAQNQSSGTMIVNGTIVASEFGNGVAGSSRNQVTLLTGPFVSSPTFGVAPIGCLAWRWASSLNANTYMQVPTSNLLATRNLVTPDNATNFPAASNVRAGVTYGIGGAVTGTCAVPPAASVGVGVPVGNTTGTAILTAADIWNTLTSTMNTTGSIGERLKNCSTVASAASQLAAAVTPV